MAKTPDFSIKTQFPAEQLIAGLQRKAEVENQQKVDHFNQRMNLVKDTVQGAGSVVAGMVEHSKNRQRTQFIQSLADSMSSAINDPQKSMAVRSAINLNPNPFISQLAENTLASPVTGTPPRSFESYLISQVNEGKMTPEEAALSLGRMKPSNIVIGYTQSGQPIYSNSKATVPGAQPLPVGNIEGGVYEKPERVSETELGKQADVQNLRIAAKEIEDSFDPSFVGAAEGRLNKLKQMVPGLATEQRANFITALSSYRNSVIKAITGAQMSEPEATRIMRQLPDETMSETDFKAKLRLSRKLLEQGLAKRQSQLQKGGFTGVPETESSVPQTPFNIDPAAIDAELKRRGL